MDNTDITVNEEKMPETTGENIKAVSETFAKSLNDTQLNATSTESSVNQVMTMSGRDIQEQLITAILAADDINTKEKISLAHDVNEDFSRYREQDTDRVNRMQSNQTQNVAEATNGWGYNWGVIIAGTTFTLLVLTPQGRRILAAGIRKIKPAI